MGELKTKHIYGSQILGIDTYWEALILHSTCGAGKIPSILEEN
jgi:hypothetical protein